MVRSLLVVSILLCLIQGCTEGETSTPDPLLCYVGGTMRPAMEVLAGRYEDRTGRKVLIDYAGSGELLVKIEQTRRGDLYVAHDPFLAAIMRKGLGEHGWVVAALKPVIVVPKGNPKKLQGLRDLAAPGVRVVLSHPVYSTAGWIIPVMAGRAGVRKALEANVISRTKGGSGAANAVIMGTADAAICWGPVAHLRGDRLDAVEIEPAFLPIQGVDAITSATFGVMELACIKVTVATLKCSQELEQATGFAVFLASEEAARVWSDFGFSSVEAATACAGPAPPLSGELLVHCAAGMRLPIRRLAEEFQRDHGVRVNMTYAGSNMLLGQIDLNRRGDVYIAGDADYVRMAQEKGLVQSRRTICTFTPVIMVGKGNPHGIRALSDLTRPGIRIGQGDEKAAAVGRLTPRLLDLNGVDRKTWNRNVVLSTPTVNELGLKVKLGTIDAAVVWRCIARKYPMDSTIVEIDPERVIRPEVAGAVLTTAENPAAAAAFLAFLASEQGRKTLEQYGYTVMNPEGDTPAPGER